MRFTSIKLYYEKDDNPEILSSTFRYRRPKSTGVKDISFFGSVAKASLRNEGAHPRPNPNPSLEAVVCFKVIHKSG